MPGQHLRCRRHPQARHYDRHADTNLLTVRDARNR